MKIINLNCVPKKASRKCKYKQLYEIANKLKKGKAIEVTKKEYMAYRMYCKDKNLKSKPVSRTYKYFIISKTTGK